MVVMERMVTRLLTGLEEMPGEVAILQRRKKQLFLKNSLKRLEEGRKGEM